MHHLWIGAASFVLGFLGSFVGAISSGGGLISIPGFIFLGLSPSAAIATTRLNVLTGSLASIYKFNKAKAIHWERSWPFVPVAIIGGIIGSKILLSIDEAAIEKLVGVLLLLLAPIMFFNKDMGSIQVETSHLHQRLGFFVMLLVMIYSTLFGGGGGTFTIYTLIYFYGMTVIPAIANGAVIGLAATIPALLIYISHGSVNFAYGLPMMVGGGLGGYLGARTAIKKGNKLVRSLFLVIIIASSIKLIFF